MRSGRLLAEESPQVLLSMYGCQSLEEVFLKLSRKQGNETAQDANLTNNISLVSLVKRSAQFTLSDLYILYDTKSD